MKMMQVDLSKVLESASSIVETLKTEINHF